MPSMKIIKRRISSVSSTQQIMRAMDLVAASKLQKAKALLDEVRPLRDNLKTVMDGLSIDDSLEDNLFLEQRSVKNAAYVLITSDRGLCGGYNLNVSKALMAHINARADVQERIVTLGSKGWEFCRRRGKKIAHRYPGMVDAIQYEDAERIGNQLIQMYTAGEVDQVFIAYTKFESMLSYVPQVVRLLPFGDETEEQGEGQPPQSMRYEPDLSTFITYAVPMYLKTYLYGAMIESAVCEQAARMTNMDAATRNAEDIIDNLTLEYNRKRQSSITQEITEIVSGANALQ